MSDDPRPVLQLEGNLIAFDLDQLEAPRLILFCPRCRDEMSIAVDALAAGGDHPFPCGHPAARLSASATSLLLRLLAEMRHLSGTLPRRPVRRPHDRFERRNPHD